MVKIKKEETEHERDHSDDVCMVNMESYVPQKTNYMTKGSSSTLFGENFKLFGKLVSSKSIRNNDSCW